MWSRVALLVAVCIQLLVGVNSRGAGECAMLCNDLRFEVLTLEICRYVASAALTCAHTPQLD
jgi:hypothetical protein